METVCILNTPGVTEDAAVELARKRLELRGKVPAAKYGAELVGLTNAAVKIWQVSFLLSPR